MERHKPEFPYLPGPYQFWPPKSNPIAQLYGQSVIRSYMRKKLGITEFEVAGDGLERLRQLEGQRVVLCSNHPAHEPVLMFRLSCEMRRKFYYFAAREVFIKSPLQGFVLQHLGCFSVVRGTNDKQAFRCARDIIVNNDRWMVAFPEGQDYYQVGNVQPFENGVVQLGFWALDQLAKAGKEGGQPDAELPPVHYLPVATHYHYLAEMNPAIDDALATLEGELGVKVQRGAARPEESYARLVSIAEAVLLANEEHYNVESLADDTVQQRMARLQEHLLERAVKTLNIPPPREDRPLLDRLRQLFNVLDKLHAHKDAPDYVKELAAAKLAVAAELHRDLYRALNFYAVSSTYILERPTVERFFEILGRLWREVMGKERFWQPQKAVITVGQPINIVEHYASYKKDKRGVVTELTKGLEDQVRGSINRMAQRETPFRAQGDSTPAV